MKQRARVFAEKMHAGQTRKLGVTPYIEHPIRVAKRLEDNGASEALIAAGYLHDVVEDTPVTIEEIEQQFGKEVARLVALHTENKTKTWQERKQHTIDTVKETTLDGKQLIVADKLDNLLSLEKSLNEQGDIIWDAFNAGKEKQKWYNKSIANNMYDQINKADAPPFFEEFEKTVTRVFD